MYIAGGGLRAAFARISIRMAAKGKDLNGLAQKAFSYSSWQTTIAKRESEHTLNRFPLAAAPADDIYVSASIAEAE
jgi:hypothetical protein